MNHMISYGMGHMIWLVQMPIGPCDMVQAHVKTILELEVKLKVLLLHFECFHFLEKNYSFQWVFVSLTTFVGKQQSTQKLLWNQNHQKQTYPGILQDLHSIEILKRIFLSLELYRWVRPDVFGQ